MLLLFFPLFIAITTILTVLAIRGIDYDAIVAVVATSVLIVPIILAQRAVDIYLVVTTSVLTVPIISLVSRSAHRAEKPWLQLDAAHYPHVGG